MTEQEYIPSMDDWNDFKESNTSRDSKNNDNWEFVVNGKKQLLSRETICTIVSDLLANTLPKETIESVSLFDRLTVLSLFGYDLSSLVKIICTDLSKDELVELLNGKEYPYLTKQLSAVVGDSNLESYREVHRLMRGSHVLPYKQFFDEDWSSINKHLMRVRRELISVHNPQSRPMWSIRVPVLKKIGIDDETINSHKIVKADCVKFLKNLFGMNKNLLADFRSQFGISSQYLSVNKQMKFAMFEENLSLFECYFNVKFTNIPNNRNKQKLFFIFVDNWYRVDHQIS